MRVGILSSSISQNSQKGYYNLQEVGLAKELDKRFTEVIVYKLIHRHMRISKEKIEGTENSWLLMIPSHNIGNNGIFDVKYMDKSIDVLIFFCDMQLIVPKVYKWTKVNGIKFIPYIGVVSSHSNNKTKKIIMNALFKRNLSIYKKCICLVKTPEVKKELINKGVTESILAPIGIDVSLMKNDYKEYNCDELKRKYSYSSNEKVLLFIGRFTEEKRPQKVIEIYKKLYEADNEYRLLMVGDGELKTEIQEYINSNKLDKIIKIIERIPNSQIWELYRIADVFLNLNRQEIFGMSILEAMYYECKVVAWRAPGPDFIIEDGISGYLVESENKAFEKIKEGKDLTANAHQRVNKYFTWENTAKKLYSLYDI